jgi:chorismate dehydratase
VKQKTINKEDFKILLPYKTLAGHIKLGKYKFLNCLPVNLPMEVIPESLIESHFGTPELLNHMLIENKIMAGPISTFEYLKYREKFCLISDISISSRQKVGSVILFSHFCFEDLAKKNIAVAFTSSTSVKLLQILINSISGERARLTVHYYEHSVEDYLQTYDGVLFIGDPALLSAWRLREQNKIFAYDLAELWYTLTGLPAVFGVWVANKSWAENNPEEFTYICNTLIKAKNMGLVSCYGDVLLRAVKLSGLPETLLNHYYKQQLSYELSANHLEAIDKYYCQLKKNNLIY